MLQNTHQVELAARNNAIWCDSVCRAHGVPGQFLSTLWLNRKRVPPYHSNLVVLSDSGDPAQTLESIRELIDLPLTGHWSVKDSFFNLELATLGFEVLFEASWIWRNPAYTGSGSSSPGIHWSRIASPADLPQWEAAWTGNPRNTEIAGKPVQFPLSLLEDREIVFFAGSQGQEIIAGGIANRTDEVVGLSNVYVNTGNVRAAWSGLVNCVQAAFPGLPMVGYERNGELESALACGFKQIGSLRVWLHAA